MAVLTRTGWLSGRVRAEAVAVVANMRPRRCGLGWRPAVNGEHKITGCHRERAALVYLRQSSMVQVREHAESTMRQYGLVEEAIRLGWPRSDVEVIDTDLGISGRFGVARAGFADLVGRVCSGEVGAIFGIEISRLARSNADVARLMEFARITGTLLIDADGVYDLGDINDRMLLGLKGTMGEVELHVMAAGCRRPNTPPPNAASCALRCRSASSTTSTANQVTTR